MTESEPISENVRQILAELRDLLNLRFRQKAALGSRIDGASWLRVFEQVVIPSVESIHRQSPALARSALVPLYEVGLDLAAKGNFSEAAGSALLWELWREVFPRIPSLLSHGPRGVAGSLSNAILNLNQVAPESAKIWLRQLRDVAPACESPEQLLDLGKFLGWIAGLAHLRTAAVSLSEKLPAPILRSALKLGDSISEKALRSHLRGFANYPWGISPGRQSAGQIEEVAQCGNFRGLGGHFVAPPKCYLAGNSIRLSDGESHWAMHADRFGHTLHREPSLKPASARFRDDFGVDKTGKIKWGRQTLQRSDLASATSQVFDGQTLAITIPTSYHVFLFARPD